MQSKIFPYGVTMFMRPLIWEDGYQRNLICIKNVRTKTLMALNEVNITKIE